MAKGNQSSKPFNSLFQGMSRLFRKGRQTIAHQLQGWVIKVKRRSRYNQAGFVLPTVTMVLLVVVLLSLAITFRAFDRAQDARFTRVSEATLQAATPAIDRARAKIAKVLRELEEDPTAEISDQDIYKALTLSGAYTFPDEQVLQVSYDIDDNGSIQPNGEATDNSGLLDTNDAEIRDNEQITTAWRFPIDTNNNGAFDSFTLYGIYFRNPEIGKVRTPLDARSLPLPPFSLDDRQECAYVSGSNDNLVTDEGWIPMTGKLKKSFFVYTVSVPIDPEMKDDLGGDYEVLQGASGFSPLEYHQEWEQKLFTGVVYKDDLEIAPGPEFNFNGSLLTKSNLIISHFGNGITLYQVSSKDSCFYQEDLSKIQVAGNVINDMVGRSDFRESAEVHLFQGRDDDPLRTEIETATQSIDGGGTDAKLYLYNDAAYEKRLEQLVGCQLDNGAATDPPLVTRTVERQRGEDPTLTEVTARRIQLTNYFSNRLRKVPIAEVEIGDDENLNGCGYLQGTEETLAPPDEWANIDDSGINVRADQPEATEPGTQQENGVENYLGDRLKVGINLPALELNEEEKWVPATEVVGTWTGPEEFQNEPRTRITEAEPLPSAGDLTRDGFWEKAAALEPATALKGIGGLRVITGAGYYEPDVAKSFLRDPNYSFLGTPADYDDPATPITEAFPVVWPDTMPMSYPDPTVTTLKGDLQMRATAVYHYAQDAFNPPEDTVQEPIACVSSYYDPSTSITAVNKSTLPWNNTASGDGRSNNGIVYGSPATGRPTGATLNNTTGIITVNGAVPELANQANYVFPDGRFANEPLRDALISLSDGIATDNLTLSQQAAIDSTLCAIDIAQGNITPDNSLIPHGAIREVAMLNAREVKAIDADNATTTDVDETFTLSSTLAQPAQLSGNYDQPLEDRQPLEIRLTVIDLDAIRQKEVPSNLGVEGLEEEFLLPYSGIIYASRDDALPDRSDRTPDGNEIDQDKSAAISPVDFKLDPTRRPNGILLVNGKSLWRNESYNEVEEVLKEKGLTLVSNLPVYIQAQRDGDKGVFNSHDILEFGETELEWGFNDFYGRTEPAQDFACRAGDRIREDLGYPCGGDNWRPATIFADAITLLSDNYRFGYRNEGDFDHRNNAANAIVGYDWDNDGNSLGTTTIAENNVQLDLDGDGNVGTATIQENEVTAKIARQLNGFNGYNDFVVNGFSSGATFGIEDDPENDGEINNITNDDFTDELYRNNSNNALDSSYFNNFATPIQRRGEFPEYVMEICLKLPVSACQPNDWVVIDDAPGATGVKASTTTATATAFTQIDGSGTTARLPDQNYQRYPRRVAFLRNTTTNNLELDGSGLPIPIAIDTGGNVECYYDTVNAPATNDCSQFNAANINQPENALWFKTNDGGENWGSNSPLFYYDPNAPRTSRTNFTANVQQPLLIPVLQIHATDDEPGGDVGTLPEGARANAETRWLPRPERNIEFNFVMGAGDVPGRPLETNGGLQNLARVLENWKDPNERSITILGSFVQSGRSKYATAPYLSAKDDLPLFGGDEIRYNIANAQRRIPYFMPPGRNWGYDVGLLSQPPDYFARKFAQLESEQVCEKNEDGEIESCDKQYKVTQYFKEVGKDDPWVKGLLCSKVVERSGNPDDPDSSSYQEIGNAASENARGSQCEKNGYE